MQSIWKGAISFGLVSIPIRLYSATEERSVSLHQVHAADGGRIRYKRVCSVDGEEVPYSDIAKGYDLPDGGTVVLTDEDMAELPLASSRAIEVLSFIGADEVDPVQLSRAYYCDPTGADAKPYVLLRDSLERTGKVALVKVALRQRESLAVLRPRDGILVLQTLLWPDEVRQVRFGFQDADVTLRPQEVQMAESYVEALTGEVDPDEMVDRYRVALESLVEAKAAGREVARPEEPQEDAGTVVDLMEALRRSVAAAKQSRGERVGVTDAVQPAGAGGEAGPATKAPARKAPARKAASKTGASKTGASKTGASKTAAKKTPAKKAPAAEKSGAPKKAARNATRRTA